MPSVACCTAERPRRRSRLALLGALLALGGCGGGEAQPPRSLVLVVVDTLRADHLGPYGAPRGTTPQLDRLASSAALFEQAHSTSSWTLPAFASLFTGVGAARHGAGRRVDEPGAEAFVGLGPELPTLAGELASAGFSTAGAGNNPFLHPGFGLARGFARWDYVFGRYDRHPNAAQMIYWGLRWLDTRDERPFFLFLHLFDPHLPYAAPPAPGRARAPALGAPFEHPFRGFGAANATWHPRRAVERDFVRAAYRDEVRFVDAQLAHLFAGLRERGLADETLVVLTSDHGEELFEHGGFEHGHSLHAEVMRVPLLVWGPGVRPGRHAQPVSLVDLAPTLLAAFGVAPAGPIEGRSLWPLLQGGPPPAPQPLAAQGTLHGGARAAWIDWPWKLLLDGEEQAARLYDLGADPAEQRDLAPEQAERVAALRAARSAAIAQRAASAAQAPATALGAEIEEQLEALGYLDGASADAPEATPLR